MIIAYVWKCDRAPGYTTAYWDRVKRKYDCVHFKDETFCFQWLKRQAPGYYLIEVQEFLKRMSEDELLLIP